MGLDFIHKVPYLTPNNSFTLAFNSSPLRFLATIFPFASNINVEGISSTLYINAIGSCQPFKLEICVQVNLSLAIAFFHFAASSSKETPMMFKPLLCNSLYNATTFGFSALHGPHQDAQKSTIVTFPKDSFKETIFPSGVFAEKLAALFTFFFPFQLVISAFLVSFSPIQF